MVTNATTITLVITVVLSGESVENIIQTKSKDQLNASGVTEFCSQDVQERVFRNGT